ncbi:MAG: alcohol dehydrogenase catalytic domain-containing protein [Planctomycetes bacterium]|nr:alcohol dehydrogenase catalytic domain-containing protein [Planctomycetota bacterium]
MKAALLTATRTIEVIDTFALPEPGPDDVVIDVKASGICGSDVHVYNGSEGSTAVTLPLVMGHEFSGVIAETGSAVAGLSVGDKVVVNPNIMCGHCHPCRSGRSAFCENHTAVGVSRHGGFAEHVVVPTLAVHVIKKTDFVEASLIEPLSCCMNVFEQIPHRLGDAYLIVGGGPIGMMMLQLARLAGARFVAVSELVPEKRNKCLALGADAAFDSTAEAAGDVAARFGVTRFDTIIECVGRPATQEYALSCAGRMTNVMFFGLGSSGDTIPLNPYRQLINQNTLYASFINPCTFERTVEIVEAGKVNLAPILAGTITLDQLDGVLADAALRSAGKVVVTF